MLKRSECNCICHTNLAVMHIQPCCEPDVSLSMPPMYYVSGTQVAAFEGMKQYIKELYINRAIDDARMKINGSYKPIEELIQLWDIQLTTYEQTQLERMRRVYLED